MTQQTPPESFDALPIPRRELPQADIVSYRVYKTPSEFVVVPAQTALEALQVSGIKNAHKIERHLWEQNRVLGMDSWQTDAAPVATAAPQQPAPTAAAAAPETKAPPAAAETPSAAAAPAAPETPLSNADVEKLLNNQ